MKLARRIIAKSTPPVGAWNIDYVYYNPPSSLCWDGRTAAIAGTAVLNFSARDTFPSGLYVKSDNTKLFMVGSTSDRVDEFAMSNNYGLAFTGTKSVATEETVPTCLTFSPDGIFMYVLGSTGDDVNQYTLSTAWTVSTAAFTRVSTASVTNAEATTQGVFFKPDGLAMYTVGSTLNTVREYSLSTAWNVSTLAFVRSFSVGAVAPVDISFDPTGTKMRVLSDFGTGGQFLSYTLSTAWNISTATLDFARPTTPSLGDATVQAGFFESTGRHVFVTGTTAPQVFYPYVLGGFDISAKETQPTSIAFSDDGTKMYVYGSISDSVHQYTLSTAWDVGTAVFLQSFAIADGSPNGLAFSSDGLKLYSIGTSNVREHTLSTAWNISTATFVRTQSFVFTTGEALFTGIYFDSTGTRAYTVGSGSDNVYQYSLSTAWNISTTTYVRAKSVAAQDTVPQDVFFKPDGKTMFVLGQVGGVGVYPGLLQYTLSTAWDISTATFTRFKPTETEENTATGFTFKPDGTKMYIVGTKNKVFQYSLGVA